MVTIIGYKECISNAEKVFYSLVLQGELSVSQSESGNMYLTANKASIMTSFTEQYCISLVGKQLPGHIKKVSCEGYEYLTSTGETVVLDYRYEYSPKEESVSKQATIPAANQMQNQIPFNAPRMEGIRAIA
jgi:hypothetical protein